jgi:hypothetical protein
MALLSTIQLRAQNGNNPIQDALLRWYPANQVTQFSTCDTPEGLAFDGAHMWVACSGSLELLEFNTSDGSVVQTVPVANAPAFLLYDGENIWATNPKNNSVTKVLANSSSNQAVVPLNAPGTEPAGLTFDGRNIWVTNSATTGGSISKIDATGTTAGSPITVSGPSGTCVDPLAIAYVASDPGSPAANGLLNSLWVVCTADPGVIGVVEVNPTNPSTYVGVTMFNKIGACAGCNNMAFDGRYFWLPTSDGPIGHVISLLQIDTTNLVVTPTDLTQSTAPIAAAFDGLYVWVVDASSPTVFKVLPSTTQDQSGTVLGPYFTGGGTSSFAAFDGGNVWVSISNSSNQTFSVLKM